VKDELLPMERGTISTTYRADKLWRGALVNYYWRVFLPLQEPPSGTTIWNNYLEQLSGTTIWNNYLEQLSGTTIWNNYLEQLSGTTIWNNYLEQLSGTTLWNIRLNFRLKLQS
jgi:hypothetical protein